MTILDTFYIMFRGDTSDLEKGQKRAKKTTDDLEGSIKNTQRSAQGLGVTFVDLATDAAAALATIVSLGAGVKSIFNTENETLGIARFAKVTGDSTGRIYEWGRAVKNVAGESADVIPDIQKLNSELVRYQLVGGAITQAPLSGFLTNFLNNGVAINKGMSAYDVMLKSAQKVDELRKKGLSEIAINNFLTNGANGLGFSAGTAQFLQQGSGPVLAQLKKILEDGVPTEEDARKVVDFAASWGILHQNIDSFGRAIAGPVLDFLNNFPAMMRDNKEAFDNFVATVKIGGAILAVAMVPFVTELIIAQAPIIIFTALLGALYLAIQKVGATRLGNWARDVGAAYDTVTTKIGKFLAYLAIQTNDNLSAADKVEQIKAIMADDNPFGPVEKGKTKEKYGPQIPVDKRAAYTPSSTELMAAARATVDIAARTPITSQTSNSVISRSNAQTASVHIDKVEVNAPNATDSDGIAQGIAASMANHLGRAFSQVIANYDNGIHA